ncbi:MAG: signal peptidase I [bacterium]|nr:signal peptidase I [bacterium]
MKGKALLRSFLYGIGSLAVVVGVVYAVRYYVGESYRISTNAMAEALKEGDYIVVNKWPKAPAERRGEVVLFHSPLRRDSLERPLFVGRVLGVPGDTVVVKPDGYAINGKEMPHAPQALSRYFITTEAKEPLLRQMKQLGIPVREWQEEAFGCTVSLTTFEEYRLRSELPQAVSAHLVAEQTASYRLIVPRKGRAYRLDATALICCREIIERESQGKARFQEGKLFLDGRETTFFIFQQDYFWILADNSQEGIDSRHLGLVPADQVIGHAWFCWYSKDKQRRFKWIH